MAAASQDDVLAHYRPRPGTDRQRALRASAGGLALLWREVPTDHPARDVALDILALATDLMCIAAAAQPSHATSCTGAAPLS